MWRNICCVVNLRRIQSQVCCACHSARMEKGASGAAAASVAAGEQRTERTGPLEEHEQTTAFLQLWVRTDDHSVLDLMTDDSRVQCISRMRLRAFAKGEKIVERAQPNSSIFFLKSGCALVMRNAQVCESRGSRSLKYCI